MGGVAASGGYWISMSSDEVIADAATITGSIGVVGMLPTGEKLMEKLSIHTGGYTTTWLAGGYDPRRPLDPRLAAVVKSSIEHTYADFTGKAAQARKKTPDQIDAVGQGRVWTGSQALERGLVDKLGSLNDAIVSAAKRAKLGDAPTVRYVEAERGPLERVLSSVTDAAAPTLRASVLQALGGIPQLPVPLREAQADMTWLAEQARAQAEGPASARAPVKAIVHCLCVAP
jgi:protease IV